MDNTIIKLRIKAQALTSDSKEIIKSKFIQACFNLDASILEPLINEDHYFQDLDKYRFLHSLQSEFYNTKRKGISKTTLTKGSCYGCKYGHETHQFYGNSNVPEFSYILHDIDGVFDIFICNLSSGKLYLKKK